MNPLYYDLIVAVILLIFVLLGAKRGLILSLCGMLAVLVALVGSAFVARSFAPQVADLLEPRFATVIESQLTGELADALQNGLPEPDGDSFGGLLGLLSDTEIYHELSDLLNSALEQGASDIASVGAARLAEAAAELVSYPLLLVVSFILILLLWTAASHLLDLAFHLPVLKSFNGLGGALFGLIKGILIILLLIWLARRFALLPSAETLAQTKLLSFFTDLDPLSRFLA